MWKPRVGQEEAEIEGRRYLRSMSTSDRTQPVAMIVCLHGRFGNGRSFCRAIRHQFEQTPGLLLLFPDGTAFGAGWNDGRVADDTDDFGFLTKMIAAERARFPSIGRAPRVGDFCRADGVQPVDLRVHARLSTRRRVRAKS